MNQPTNLTNIKIYEEQQQQYGQNAINNDSFTQQNSKKPKKKRKHKAKPKLKPKHPPQYYQQLRKQKQLKRRQLEWDSRFNLGMIPDISLTGVGKIKTKTKLKSLKRADSPKQGVAVYKTFNLQGSNKPKPSKSFNIRIVPKKQQKEDIKAQRKLHTQAKKQRTKQIKQQHEQQKQQQKPQKQTNPQQQQLLTLINTSYQQQNFLQSHYNILVSLVKKSKSKQLKNFITSQLQKLKNKTSNCSSIQNIITKRNAIIKQLQQQKNNRNAQNIKKYQLLTLKIIQQILKWKDQLESVYFQLTRNRVKVVLEVEGQNYLYTIYRGFGFRDREGGEEGKNQEKVLEFQGNPFLLGYLNTDIQEGMAVKIRACEMMLLQQQIQKLTT